MGRWAGEPPCRRRGAGVALLGEMCRDRPLPRGCRGAHTSPGERDREPPPGGDGLGDPVGEAPPRGSPAEGTGEAPSVRGPGEAGSGKGLGGPPAGVREWVRAEGRDTPPPPLPAPSVGPEGRSPGAGRCPTNHRPGAGCAPAAPGAPPAAPGAGLHARTGTLSSIPLPLQFCPSPPPRCCFCCWGSSCSMSPCWCSSSSPPSLA